MDKVVASAAEAGGGHSLSRADLQPWIVNWLRQHPTATDEQACRASARHNGHSDGYDTTIWNHYRRLFGDS